MIVTTYTCDKCGHSQTDNAQMWLIGVYLQNHRIGGLRDNSCEELWCRPCVEALHLLPLPTPKPDDPPPPPAPSLEDMIREIVHEENDHG